MAVRWGAWGSLLLWIYDFPVERNTEAVHDMFVFDISRKQNMWFCDGHGRLLVEECSKRDPQHWQLLSECQWKRGWSTGSSSLESASSRNPGLEHNMQCTYLYSVSLVQHLNLLWLWVWAAVRMNECYTWAKWLCSLRCSRQTTADQVPVRMVWEIRRIWNTHIGWDLADYTKLFVIVCGIS